MIEWLQGLADERVLPRPAGVSAPFFAAAARGELTFQRCAAGHPFLYPRLACPVCGSRELGWEAAGGRGEIISFAAVHRPAWNDLERPAPVVLIIVRLDEGPRMLSTLERASRGQARIGLPVQAAFERIREGLGLVRFTPADDPVTDRSEFLKGTH
jgi:uncharacterized OB-fold protein